MIGAHKIANITVNNKTGHDFRMKYELRPVKSEGGPEFELVLTFLRPQDKTPGGIFLPEESGGRLFS
jgi:hypothetical protein